MAPLGNIPVTWYGYLEDVDTQTIPLKMLAGRESYNKSAHAWELAGPKATGRNRRFTVFISFETEFSMPPVVHLSLCGIDIDHRDHARLRVHAEDISPLGFLLVAETWFDTRVHGFDVSWLALGS